MAYIRKTEIVKLGLPEGITKESASYALDGPMEQRISDLNRIVSALDGWDTEEAVILRDEAQEYLDELTA